VFPFLFQVSPSILRVRSVLLVKEASDLIDSAAKPGMSQPDAPRFRILTGGAIETGVELGGFAESCIGLISTLTSHIDGLTKLLTELPSKDEAGAGSLRASLVTSLTALSETLDLMSRISHEPLATDYRHRSIAVLMRAIDIVHGLGHKGFTIIGTFLGVRCPQLGQQLSLNNPELTLAVQISLRRLSALLDATISRLYRTPVEGIDFDSLNSGASILAEAKEWLLAAFHPAPSIPDSLSSKLAELMI